MPIRTLACRYLILIMVSFALFASCHKKPSPRTIPVQIYETEFVTIAADTIYPAIKGTLRDGILHDDKYYTVSNYPTKDKHNPFIRQLVTFDRFGENMHIYPDSVLRLNNYGWTNFRIKNDSVLLVPEEDWGDTVYFNTKVPAWEKVSDIVIPYYEDARYCVTYEGERGYDRMTYFREKETGRFGVIYGVGNIAINEYGGEYYATILWHFETISSTIIKISPDSTKNEWYFDNTIIVDMTNPSVYYRRSQPGIARLYEGEDVDIKTSFVHKGRLLHMHPEHNYYIPLADIEAGEPYPWYVEQRLLNNFPISNRMHLSILENGELHTIHTFEDIEYTELIQQVSPEYQIMRFISKSGKGGFMEIKPDTIHLHYIHNVEPTAESPVIDEPGEFQ